ncbi:hypothetical protein [Brevibacillus fortis]|uniref:Uncharacterized protein n=1 Tax=Brevibacillus fortis TaxID=2126352 RepID=A0A2P7VJ56_9BACL|nr:hypothetical protein [Brevibacillus fortis]PSJ99242.1 hypothetical protein C7R93_05115 [Brevibacillus fortis]
MKSNHLILSATELTIVAIVTAQGRNLLSGLPEVLAVSTYLNRRQANDTMVVAEIGETYRGNRGR